MIIKTFCTKITSKYQKQKTKISGFKHTFVFRFLNIFSLLIAEV